MAYYNYSHLEKTFVHQSIRKGLREVHDLCKMGLTIPDGSAFVYGDDYVAGCSQFLLGGLDTTKKTLQVIFPDKIRDGNVTIHFLFWMMLSTIGVLT